MVALTSTDAPGARIAAERLRVAIEGLVIHDDGGARVAVTASLGLAGWRPTESLEGLIGRADAAMYASKASGRNCVSVCAQHDDADEAPISGVA